MDQRSPCLHASIDRSMCGKLGVASLKRDHLQVLIGHLEFQLVDFLQKEKCLVPSRIYRVVTCRARSRLGEDRSKKFLILRFEAQGIYTDTDRQWKLSQELNQISVR